MPERPLLIFPKPENVDLPKGRRGFSIPPKPLMSDMRKQTISSQFESAINYIQSIVANVNPEAVLVIETIGRVQDLYKAVRRIDGLEWLGEWDLEEIEIEENLYDKEKDKKEAEKDGGRLYLISSNTKALDEVYKLWKKLDKDGNLPRNYGKWKDVFNYIKEMRYWNEKDRIEETGILNYWKEEIEIKKDSLASNILFQIDLHFFNDNKAKQSEKEIADIVESLSGNVSKRVRIKEIGFHALKVNLPAYKVQDMWKQYEDKNEVTDNKLVKLDCIKYFLPIPQQLIEDKDEDIYNFSIETKTSPSHVTEKPPVIALLDGLPMANHTLLEDRLIIDDPDDIKGSYSEGNQKKHGTSMASLICCGDLNNQEHQSQQRRIYVRPIMQPNELSTSKEEIPKNEFPEDLLERAIINIFGEKEGHNGVAPSIRVINLSIGNLDQPFFREMSSWARLLDWLSWKYKVLFIISAGNFTDEIQLSEYEPSMPSNLLLKQVIKEMNENNRKRRILSPAESINSLTVGAMASDHSTIQDSDPRIDFFKEKKFIAEYSRLGPGYKQSIKPDILVAGGRQLFTKSDDLFRRDNRSRPPGQKFAYKGSSSEDIKNIQYGRGTSNATALTTHTAGLLYEVIMEIQSGYSEKIPEQYESLLLKSLLVHGASWRGMEENLEFIKNPTNSRTFKRVISKYLGYGESDFSRVMECTARRITSLGFGEIGEEERHRFVLPIPDVCKGIRYKLIATLAYFTPINPFHANYRKAKLSFNLDPDLKIDSKEADDKQARNGTVQHKVCILKNIQSDIHFFVECRADAVDSLDENIPYALSLTIEAEKETNIDIYEEIRQVIITRVPARL